uniref:Hemagglutinin n=1 Tax=Newt influenza virus TaxID=2982031 RepID=A0A9N7ABB6_9ORTO|nr:TPA_asm: hemagglutinin [Newt influenza virus]
MNKITIIGIAIMVHLSTGEINNQVCVGKVKKPQNGTVETVTSNKVPVTGKTSIAGVMTPGKICSKNSKIHQSPECNKILHHFNYKTCKLPTSGETFDLVLTGEDPPLTDTLRMSATDYAKANMNITWRSQGGLDDFTAEISSTLGISSFTSEFNGASYYWYLPVTRPGNFSYARTAKCSGILYYGAAYPPDGNYEAVTGRVPTAFWSIKAEGAERRELPLGGPNSDEQKGYNSKQYFLPAGSTKTNLIVLDALRVEKGKLFSVIGTAGTILIPKIFCDGHFPVEPQVPMDATCEAKCHSPLGSFPGNNSFIIHQSTHTSKECPPSIKRNFDLVQGVRVDWKTGQSRGFFGAIAGFFTGGIQGAIDGWFGVAHQASGVGVAADQASTQEAVGKITDKLNQLVEAGNSRYQQVRGEFERLSSLEMNLKKSIDDLRLDTFTEFIRLETVLANSQILKEQDDLLINKKLKIKSLLGPDSLDLGNGCFNLTHHCDQACLESISNETYSPEKYIHNVTTFGEPIIGAVNLEYEWRWILVYVSVSFSGLTLAIAIAAGIMFVCKSGGCTICI